MKSRGGLIKSIINIFGYLSISISGNGIIRFLNICKNNNLFLWNIEIRDDELVFQTSIKDFFRMRRFSKKTAVKIRIVSKNGKIFKIIKYKKRYFFLLGICIFLILIKIISLYIWNISVTGNYSYTEKFLIDFLNENDIKCVEKINELDCDEIEFIIRKNFNDIVWVSAEIKGTKLIIHIKENFDSNIAITEDKPYNIISNCNGVIESIITRDGSPKVKSGDTVENNQLLVSGVLELQNDNLEIYDYKFVNADADIYAYVREDFKQEFSMIYDKKIYTGETKKAFKINILDKSLYFSWFNKKYKSSEMVKDYRELSLTDNFYIPISYEKIKFIEYEVVDTSYTNDEAQIKANEIINNYIKNLNEKGIQIIENNVKIEISENKCFIYGDFLLLKQSGKIEYTNEEDYNSKITVSQETE